ncbi:GNAT family N-acetyltransferase [Anaerocolumna sp. AGMB13025]|uniref:GNAT family N-acetyltransferase n=1 Tax=Anaerocolumna sp. AGMB13025 TaxID=3039116 RepID=UPI0024201BC7|nr:GNAT family N-acetyltransferase [Anaerocolumna sp. AGMB13025]WFR60099.1 GNAT family N-acetyltransferase [Anaerocolumna sp. AGMB13025]
MVEVKKNDRYKIGHFFKNMNDMTILSCLQGHMGRAWTDNLETPSCALIQEGTFCFLAGEKNSLNTDIISQILTLTDLDLTFVITGQDNYGELIMKYYGDDCKKIIRYRIKKKQEEFDLNQLKSIVSRLPVEYTLSPINEKWYEEALGETWSEDFVSNFSSKEDYLQRGIGWVITYKDKIISGASSYSVYDTGIEIEIATREEYRRQGLAQIVGAALILACRERGLYPSWDAANMISVQIAQKLGYEYDAPYDAYMIRRKPTE